MVGLAGGQSVVLGGRDGVPGVLGDHRGAVETPRGPVTAKILVVTGMVIVWTWPVAYSAAEWYWWGLVVGFAVVLAGMAASGGSDGGGE